MFLLGTYRFGVDPIVNKQLNMVPRRRRRRHRSPSTLCTNRGEKINTPPPLTSSRFALHQQLPNQRRWENWAAYLALPPYIHRFETTHQRKPSTTRTTLLALRYMQAYNRKTYFSLFSGAVVRPRWLYWWQSTARWRRRRRQLFRARATADTRGEWGESLQQNTLLI